MADMPLPLRLIGLKWDGFFINTKNAPNKNVKSLQLISVKLLVS